MYPVRGYYKPENLFFTISQWEKIANEFLEKMGIRAKKADTGAAGGPSPITK